MWKVVPLSKGQLKDVREEDILDNGHFRKCLTYRGGGGYDQFPFICKEILGKQLAYQFIVQLFGCNLDCPYCYVTREGVWGNYVHYSSNELVEAFLRSDQEIFHLMGGAPALQIQNWKYILDLLPEWAVFHSDIMLSEKPYKDEWINSIAKRNAIYAVDIKGLDQTEHLENTRKPFPEKLFYNNLDKIMSHVDNGLKFYFTFTNINRKNINWFLNYISGYKNGKEIADKSFEIDLIEYNALEDVDNVPWGNNPKVEER